MNTTNNAKKERNTWANTYCYNPYSLITIGIQILLTYLFFGSIWGGPIFSFYNSLIVCLSLMISKLIVEPVIKIIYKQIKK